jgi:signal transduction histidine kinase
MDNNIRPSDSLEFLNALLNDIPSAIFILDKQVKIRFFNSSFSKLFDKNETITDQFCGNALGCRFQIEEGMDCGKTSQCSKCNLRNNIITSLKTGNPLRQKISKEFEIKGVMTLKHLYIVNKPVKFLNEEMQLVIFDDITELEEQKNKLEFLNKQKNELVSIAAHDIRNPLSAIYSFSDIILDKTFPMTSEMHNDFVESIRKASKFSLNLLNDLLDFSVLESGYLTLRTEKVNYVDFIREIIDLNRIICGPRKIKIYVFITNGVYQLHFDKNKMEQVINNLLSNAIKFSPENSNIRVSVNKKDNEVVTKIKDQGPGIKQNEIENLFKPFQRGSALPTGNEKSTGLGLVIAKMIIEKHGGHIWVNSEPGQGAEFTFTIPINQISE